MPQIVLPRHLPPARRIEGACFGCEFRLAAVSEPAFWEAMRDHLKYMDDTTDHATDPHFADRRMDALLEA